MSGVPWGIDTAEAVRLTQSAPSLSGNRRQCGKKRRGQEVEVRGRAEVTLPRGPCSGSPRVERLVGQP